ncbi:MAG TPA: S-formylglutathione hydrolase [Rhodanobacteraceae bacterium]|nr:S-formylglutathione hydrolase [Rhodanobacteraceae bacterium]
MTGTIEKISEQRCFEGIQGFYRHASAACAGPMRFAVFQPPQAQKGPVPVLYYLAGLTCTEENFTIKAGAQRVAAELGLMLVMPDTSPRNTEIPGIADDFEFGNAAGFYLDATQAPYSKFFNMYTHVTTELPGVIAANFPADMARQGIFGHSMGGHGALTIALKNPGRYRSVSAFSPIVAPTRVRWGSAKAFPRFLGDDRETWKQYDACELIAQGRRFAGEILVDQGSADQFLNDTLHPEWFEEACKAAGQPLRLRLQPGYDHSYYFISTFVEDHLRHHAAALKA